MESVIDDSPWLSRHSKLGELYFQYLSPAGNFAYKHTRIEAMIGQGPLTLSLINPEKLPDLLKENSASRDRSMALSLTLPEIGYG